MIHYMQKIQIKNALIMSWK